MGNLRGDEEHRTGIFAGGYARTAADALRSIHREIRFVLGHVDGISIGNAASTHADESTLLLDAIERCTVHYQIAMHRKRRRAPRLDGDRHPVAEMPHVQLTRRRTLLPAVRRPIDDHRARATNAFATIGIKCNRFFARPNKSFVNDIKHFEEGHVRTDVMGLILFKAAGIVRIILAPNFEF